MDYDVPDQVKQSILALSEEEKRQYMSITSELMSKLATIIARNPKVINAPLVEVIGLDKLEQLVIINFALQSIHQVGNGKEDPFTALLGMFAVGVICGQEGRASIGGTLQ